MRQGARIFAELCGKAVWVGDMSATHAEVQEVTKRGVLVRWHGGRYSDGDRRPVGGLAGCVWDGFVRVAASEVEDEGVVVIEVRCSDPLHVFVGVTLPSDKIVELLAMSARVNNLLNFVSDWVGGFGGWHDGRGRLAKPSGRV